MVMRCIRLCSIRKSSTMRGGELQANSFSLPVDFTIADFRPPHNYHVKGSPFMGWLRLYFKLDFGQRFEHIAIIAYQID